MTRHNSPEYIAYTVALRDYESAHDRLWRMPTTENSLAHRHALDRYLSARADWLHYVAQQEVVA